jgi:protein-L-isoaspartate(D-aspartate) O-methyltransferase
MKNDLNSLKRKELIELLKRQGIKDERVLNAINRVRRDLFVSEEFKKFAYDNNALPISANQTISQPYTVAFMTELLNVNPGDKVLEIGTGSGYQAAVLCEMGARLYTVERIEELCISAENNLEKMEYTLRLKCDDGTKGWEEYAPYDRIIVTAGSPKVPKSLLEQLAVNGRMVIPIGTEASQEMNLIKKVQDENGEIKYLIKRFQDFKFVPLIGEEAWKVSR